MEWFPQSYKENRGIYFQVSMSQLKTLSTHNFATFYPCVVPRPAEFCYVMAFSYFTIEILVENNCYQYSGCCRTFPEFRKRDGFPAAMF